MFSFLIITKGCREIDIGHQLLQLKPEKQAITGNIKISITKKGAVPYRAQHPVLSRFLSPCGHINRNGTILDAVAGLLDLGFQIGWDLAVPIVERC